MLGTIDHYMFGQLRQAKCSQLLKSINLEISFQNGLFESSHHSWNAHCQYEAYDIAMQAHIWQIGDAVESKGIVHFDRVEDVKRLLDAFKQRGYNHIDTASNYPASEDRLGSANASADFTIDSKIASYAPGSHQAEKVKKSLEKSLLELRTNSVETLFLHTPDRETPFEETAAALNDAHQEGKFKKLGLSNYTAAEVRKFLDVCHSSGFVAPVVYQGQYNPVTRGGEDELFPLLREHNIAFYAFSPAAGGFFSNKNNNNSTRWSQENMVGRLYNSMYGSPKTQEALKTIQIAAQKFGISPHAAAIRWTTFHGALKADRGDGVIFAVSKVEQLHDTLDALEAGPLPTELADDISAVYATLDGSGPPYHQ